MPAGEYFTGLAETYAAFRPTYPRLAIEAILQGLARPVQAADIGCGTGISTRMLAEAGAEVIGIDPNQDMLAQAQRQSAGDARVEYRRGHGERTGLSDASVHVVVCAQSFHWFNAAAALREFHRILKPVSSGGGGGRLALMWNFRDDRDPFTKGYGEVVERAQADARCRGRTTGDEHAGDPTIGGWFVSPRVLTFANPQAMDLQGLLGRARSASYFPPPGALREELESELRRLFGAHQREGRVILHHRTEITLSERSDRVLGVAPA